MASMSVLNKLRKAHCKTLQLHHQGKAAAVQSAWSLAEEAAVRRQERSEVEDEIPGFLDLKSEKSKGFPQQQWCKQLPAKARVVVIDADLYPSKETSRGSADAGGNALQEDVDAAVEIVGSQGCVIILTSAPSFAESGKAIATEQGLNSVE